MHCSNVAIDPGGGGINVARVAVRLGADAMAVAFVAPDASAQFAALLAAENVRLEIITTCGPLRESFTVTESSTCRQYRFVLPGPKIDRDEYDKGLARIAELCTREKLVVVSGSCPPGISDSDVARLVAVARSSNAEVIVDCPGSMLAAVAAVGALMLKPSVHELEIFATKDLVAHADIDEAARRLLAMGMTRAVLVSMGATGALFVRPDEETVWVHAPRVHSTSTVGAGDSLVAGFAVAIGRGATMLEAARWGVAAGTAATLAHGTGLCQEEDVIRLLPQVTMSSLPRCERS
jgi:6-phosphofructokinase 2